MPLIDIEGQQPLDPQDDRDVASVVSSLEKALLAEDAVAVVADGNWLSFRGGSHRFLMWSHLPFRPIGRSEIEVVPGHPLVLRYRFSYLEAFALNTLVAVVFGAAIGAAAGNAFAGIAAFVVGAAFVVVPNYLIARTQLHAVMKRLASPSRPA